MKFATLLTPSSVYMSRTPFSKVYIIGPGRMTKMATMPISGKNNLKVFFSRTIYSITLKLSTQHKILDLYEIYMNDDPGLTLNFFLQQSQLCSFRLRLCGNPENPFVRFFF